MFNLQFKKDLHSVLIIATIYFAVNLFANNAEIQQIPKDKNSDNSPFTVFQFSFFSPLQIFSEKDNIYGFRLTLPYGKNQTLKGMDIGIANQLNNLYGISFAALLSQRSENMYGINLSGIFNISKGDDIGLSMAGFYNEIRNVEGVQAAVLYNQARFVKGVQFGLVNYCHNMNGAQVGIINICKAQPVPFTLFFNFWKQEEIH